MKKLMDRLKEPSTWVSVAVMLSMAGVTVPPGFAESAAQVGALVAAFAGVLMSEKGKPEA